MADVWRELLKKVQCSDCQDRLYKMIYQDGAADAAHLILEFMVVLTPPTKHVCAQGSTPPTVTP